MVRTDPSLDNLPPEERIKALKKLQEKKKKELEKLLKEKEEELRRTQQEIEESIKELYEEEEQHFREEEQKRRTEEQTDEEQEERTLEETIEEENPEEQTPRQLIYESPLERIRPPTNIYELSDYNLYNEIRRIEQNIREKGYITPEEQQLLVQVKEQHTRIRDAYTPQQLTTIDEQRGHYLTRTEDVLKRIDQQLHDLNKLGENIGNVYK